MLLFADGFENFDGVSLDQKWDYVHAWDIANDFTIIPTTERKGPRCLQHYGNRMGLGKNIKKSRTVFFGFALKAPNGVSALPNRTFGIYFYSNNNLVVRCMMSMGTSVINYQWIFTDTGINQQNISVNLSKDPKNGFLYYQFGITLNGNTENIEDCTAWVENRVSSGVSSGLISNIRTAIPESIRSSWFDHIRIQQIDTSRSGTALVYLYFDDVYICNSEGSKNNTFLGDVRIRPMIPENTGSINNASMINFEGSRHLGVACDFVNTVDEVPTFWDYDQYPDLIEYANPFDKYLRMTENNTQLFQMSNPNYDGAEPKIFGVVATTLCRAHEDIGKKARLELVRRHSTEPVTGTENKSMEKPILYYEDWDNYTLAWDNNEELVGTQKSTKWTPSVIGADQWGIKLVSWDDNPEEYLTGFLRLKQNHDEVLYEYLSTVDFSHRHWDREIIESLLITEFTGNYWAQRVFETFNFSETQTVTKRVHHGVGEVLYFVDELPWQYLYLKEVLQVTPEIFFAYGGTLTESILLNDSSYHEWVEELISELFPISGNVSSDIIEFIADMIEFLEPLVWDNHETIEEILTPMVSYLWSNHEELIEYLTWNTPDPIASWGQVVESSISLVDNHFDGWWVEAINDGLKMWFEGITQQWRYEWFIGVLINSVQIAPIEDTGQWGGDGNDGDRTGEW